MKDAFIFETEGEDSYPQGETSYEDFEGEYEAGDYEAEDYEDYEDFEFGDAEMSDEIRGRGRVGGGVAVRPMAVRPARRFAPYRPVRRMPYRFRPAGYRMRSRWPYRWRPGMRRYPYRYGTPYQPGITPYQPGFGMQPGFAGGPVDGLGSVAQPSSIVMLLQRLLNRIMGANLPVDGVMGVETRSALRSFQSQPDTPPPPPPVDGPPPPPGGEAPPQNEYDELEYLEGEFDEFGY